MRLILLGAPGAGKGTQGLRLAAHFGVAHVSSGEILRRHVSDGTPLGRKVASHVAEGELVPDELVLAVIGRAVVAAMETGGYLLDGFPRTLAQAERAYELAEQGDLTADAVVFLDVPDAVAIERLAERAAESGRADDASAEVVRHRLAVFHDQTVPLLDFYEEDGRLLSIDAARAPDEVFESILEALDRQLGPPDPLASDS